MLAKETSLLGELEKIEDSETIYHVMNLVILLARNGVPDSDLLLKEELEHDIQELIDEDEEDEEEGEEESYLGVSYLENFSKKYSIIPAVLYSDQYDYLTCGWLSKQWKKVKKGAKKTKKFVKKHKKEIIIGAAIVAVVVGVGIAISSYFRSSCGNSWGGKCCRSR